jgi:hypothetical protein
VGARVIKRFFLLFFTFFSVKKAFQKTQRFILVFQNICPPLLLSLSLSFFFAWLRMSHALSSTSMAAKRGVMDGKIQNSPYKNINKCETVCVGTRART